MKRFFYIVILFLATITVIFNSCGKSGTSIPGVDDSEDDPCGDQTFYSSPNMQIVNDALNGGTREIIFEDLNNYPKDICTEEHPDVIFNYSISQPLPGVSFFGKAYWSIYKQEVPMPYDNTKKTYQATMQPGLKDAFPSKPGYLYMQVIARMTSQGSYSDDTAYLRSFPATGGIAYQSAGVGYKRHKDK